MSESHSVGVDGADVITAIRTTGSIRSFADREVPGEVIAAAIEAARFGPSGGNRQPVRWIAIRDRDVMRRLADLYIPLWKRDMEKFLSGAMETGSSLTEAVQEADEFAEGFSSFPVLLVACARVEDMHAHMLDASGAPNMIGGSSVYPIIQNACLALRAQGVGTTLTTLLCEHEAEVAALLEIPDGFLCACHIAVGYPARGFPGRLKRLPVEELLFGDRFGRPFEAG